MTQKERKTLQKVAQKLDNIYCFHNKNLTNAQYHQIGEILDLLKDIKINVY